MKVLEVLKQIEVLCGRVQLYEILLDICNRIESGDSDVYSKELGDNRQEVCASIHKELVEKIEILEKELKMIHSSEVKIDKGNSKKSRNGKPPAKKATGRSSDSGSGKGKQGVSSKNKITNDRDGKGDT